MLLKEFQRLKEIENNPYNIEWNTKRILSKVNYHIQTDAVEKHIIPESALFRRIFSNITGRKCTFPGEAKTGIPGTSIKAVSVCNNLRAV